MASSLWGCGQSSGQSRMQCGHSAVRSQNHEADHPISTGLNSTNGRSPLRCFLPCQDARPSGIPPNLPLCLCSSHRNPARQCLKKTHFFGRFCGVRNASLRRTFCCVVHQKRDFKAHPAASTTLLVGSFQLAADSRLSTHSPPTLDLGSLSALGTRDPATACVDSEASSSTVALGKALSVVATKRFIVCDPHASSFLILRSGTRDPNNQSPSSTRAPSPGHPPRSCQPPSPTD